MGLGIYLVLAEETLEANTRLLDSHREWIDGAELRADKLRASEWPKLNAWRNQVPIPMILTLRRPEDGGAWQGLEEERLGLFRAQVVAKWDWWDIEESHPLPPALERNYRESGGRVLRSFHDFHDIPHNWGARMANLATQGYTPKAAVTPRNSAGLRRIFAEVRQWPQFDRVVVGMGPYGVPTRVVGADLGSLWTYAAPVGREVAPGQLDPRTLKDMYAAHLRRLGEPVYGIAGNPVAHSRSPEVHNAGLRRLDLPGVYLPFLVDDFGEFLLMAEEWGVKGLSVTLPHKEAAARLASSADRTVSASGACNTLLRTEKGWYGYNTDAPGFLHPLLEHFGTKDLYGKKATVVGTGGAARGVLYALKEAGAAILLVGRNQENRELLAFEWKVAHAPLEPASAPAIQTHNDIIIQTTSAGMGAQEGVDPLVWYIWQGTEVAYDIVYKPQETAFLKRAAQRGCATIGGWAMFAAQAQEQFRLFTGFEYPQPFPPA